MRFSIQLDSSDIDKLPSDVRTQVAQQLPRKIHQAWKRIEGLQATIDYMKHDTQQWQQIMDYVIDSER